MSKDTVVQKLEAKRARLDTLPEGAERDALAYEIRCTEETIAQIENPDTDPRHAEEGVKLGKMYARLFLLKRAADNGEPFNAEEIERKADLMKDNRTYGKLVDYQIKKAGRGKTALFDLLPGEAEEGHFTGWINDLDTGVTVDYAASLEERIASVPEEERETVRSAYETVCDFNEMIRGVDYTLAKTPEELFAVASDRELRQRHEVAVNSLQFVNENNATRKRLSEIEPKNNTFANLPVAIHRCYYMFLNHENTDAAKRENQKTVDRLCSADPDDRDFKKEFVINMINKMLAVPDADLAATEPQDKVRVLREHYDTIEGLWEMDSNFMGNIEKDFDIPGEVLTALRHKSNLVQVNFASFKKNLNVDKDPHYLEISLTEGMNVEQLSRLADVSSQDYKGKDDPALKMVLIDRLTSAAGQMVAENASENGEKVLPDKRFDGYQLKSEDVVFFREPKQPGRIARFLHGIWSGFYKKTFEKYEKELSDIRIAKEQIARKNSEKGKEHESWKEKQQAGISDTIEKNEALAAVAESLKETYHRDLDESFASLEYRTKGELNRLDHVMIGHKTLRGHLEAEYYALHPEEDRRMFSAEYQNFLEESVKNGHAEELMLGAQLAGKKVTVFRVDQTNGKLLLNEATGKPGFQLGDPNPGLKTVLTADMSYLNHPEDASDRIRLGQNCVRGIAALNYFGRAALSAQHSNNVGDQFFTSEEKNGMIANQAKTRYSSFSLTRTSLESHTVAYLMTEKEMTIEQIADPAYKPADKRLAGQKILSLFSDPDANIGEIAKINAAGSEKMSEVLRTRLKGCDVSDPEKYFTESNLNNNSLSRYVHDLDQESSKMKDAFDAEVCRRAGAGTPEEKKQALDKWSDRVLNCCEVHRTEDFYRDSASITTGNIYEYNKIRSEINQSLTRVKMLGASLKAGNDLADALGEEQRTYMVTSGLALDGDESFAQGSTGVKEYVKLSKAKTAEKAFRFGEYVSSPGFLKDMEIGTDGKIDFVQNRSEGIKPESRNSGPEKAPELK
ncbi:MAG: hypothetical protein MJ070_01730 [Lachnospiraceae bacterium]|nr:hypothetical protein [Lachnospiraceae bacterium]